MKNQKIDWIKFLSAAVAVGIQPSDFWNMTPIDAVRLIEEAAWQLNRRTIVISYLTAKLIRSKRFPSLPSLLTESNSRSLTKEEIIEHDKDFQAMSKAFEKVELNGIKLSVGRSEDSR